MKQMPSPARRDEIIGALRHGTVPSQGLDAFAVGLDRLAPTIMEELDSVAEGRSKFKAVRGEYGSGKTFFTRWVAETAKRRGFATAEVQISETETPLHRLETVYRRLVEHLATSSTTEAALPAILDEWTFALEEDVLKGGKVSEDDEIGLAAAVSEQMEARLRSVSTTSPMFATAVRSHRGAVARGDHQLAEGIVAWLGAQPNVPQAVKRAAGVKGEVDHFGALNFLQGLLLILRDANHPGLVLILDEVETLQRVRSDVREKSLNALRQLIDETYEGRFPGLYLVITGTPQFFDGNQGVQRLAPLAQRLHTDFHANSRFDNPRAPQIRLTAFDEERLVEVGVRIRDIYAHGRPQEDRIRAAVTDDYVRDFALTVAGGLGNQVGIAPRIFLRKLVDVLDLVELHEDFDPRVDYHVAVDPTELSLEEREKAFRAPSPDDVDIDL